MQNRLTRRRESLFSIEEMAKEIDKEIINAIFSKENIRKAKIKDLFPEEKWN